MVLLHPFLQRWESCPKIRVVVPAVRCGMPPVRLLDPAPCHQVQEIHSRLLVVSNGVFYLRGLNLILFAIHHDGFPFGR